MGTVDLILLWIMIVFLYAAAFLKIKLAEKKQQPYSAFWKVQLFIFPTMLLVVVVLLKLKICNWVLPGIFLGIIEEFVCHLLRKKQ